MEQQTNRVPYRQPPTSENAKKTADYESFFGEDWFSKTPENGAVYTMPGAIALGARGEKCKEAASFFGNRAMFETLNNSEERKAALNRADILVGETVPKFLGDAPENPVAAAEPFTARSVPDFSALVPVQSVQDIGMAGLEYGSS